MDVRRGEVRWRWREAIAIARDDGEGDGEGEHEYKSDDQKDGCSSAGSQGRRTVGQKHTEKEEGIGPQLPGLLRKPDAGFLYAEQSRYETGTLRAEVSKQGKVKDELLSGTASDKPRGVVGDRVSVQG